MFKNLTIILALLITLSSPVVGQDFDKGLAVYEAGNYAVALKEWRPLAEQGVAYAQQGIGDMTEEDISTAQAMASKCMSSDYKECGY